MSIRRSFSTLLSENRRIFLHQKSEMIGGVGDVSLANDRLIGIQPPAHTMSNSNVANGARMWRQCLEIPQVLGCRRVPKSHTGFAALLKNRSSDLYTIGLAVRKAVVLTTVVRGCGWVDICGDRRPRHCDRRRAGAGRGGLRGLVRFHSGEISPRQFIKG